MTDISEDTKASDNVQETIERPYKLREFKDKDLFPMLGIIKKIGISDCKAAFEQLSEQMRSKNKNKDKDKNQDNLEKVGILFVLDIADVLIGNLSKCEDEIYALWSDLSGIPVDDMKEMEFGTLPLMIYDSFRQARNTSFFKVLSEYLS